ncbi:helix-turn-helix domain-containing protein [endosymbiont GvMRE of Glomus versiforme]
MEIKATYKYRLYPTKKEEQIFNWILAWTLFS